MSIRIAKAEDATIIGQLLTQLGYKTGKNFLIDKISQLIHHPDHLLVVYEDNKVEAVMSVHFMPQLALTGEFAIISYLVVDENIRSKGIGKELEAYCVEQAKARGCDRIQLHSSLKRTGAHKFYEREGYQESPKYFSKSLIVSGDPRS
ncbi:GNAT family N-acetyltransferase [Pedobacter heparinus]|uniref:GNAT family N-acetyltransferase n=1 Tax=Pedobacter heparinus TaxID=984 RepID=UPI002931A46D|nr:GNAT family N-acetyltransferase [Pedobacter heparinus]